MLVELLNAAVREFSVKDKTCFEVTAAVAGKKGMKKYVFSFERAGDKVMTHTYIHTYIHYIHLFIHSIHSFLR